MKLNDELLMAYADGELDAKTQAQVEAAIAADPQAARRVAEHKALRSQLQSTFDPVLSEPIPERLVAAARSGPAAVSAAAAAASGSVAGSVAGAASRAPESRVVVPFRSGAKRKPSLPYWGALAASFVMGALVWHFGAGLLYQSGPITEQNGQLLASGSLDRALSSRLVKDQNPQDPVQIGVSFHSKSGSYCRTFNVRDQSSVAGLACREGDRWTLTALAKGETSGQAQSEFRPAGSSMPALVLQAVEQSIDGEPLDAPTEAQARESQWRGSR